MNIANILKINKQIVLASRSPRRKQLLESLGLDFIVHPSEIDEAKIYNASPDKYVISLAKAKAVAVSNEYSDSIIIGSDTTVHFKGDYLNKPETKEEAYQMLSSLSGNYHSVYSGISVLDNSRMILKTDYSETKVKFRNLFKDEIEQYIESGSPMDKAGAYGIQDDFGATFVERIQGDFYNVVGLPLVKLYLILMELAHEK